MTFWDAMMPLRWWLWATHDMKRRSPKETVDWTAKAERRRIRRHDRAGMSTSQKGR